MGHLQFMEHQLVNSTLATTRHFWRRRAGWGEEIVLDPRPLAEVIGGVWRDRDATCHNSTASSAAS